MLYRLSYTHHKTNAILAKIKDLCQREFARLPIFLCGTPGRNRTLDLRIRSPLLYPSELLAQSWSGREDSNLRPPAPKAGALPGCATPRRGRMSIMQDSKRQLFFPNASIFFRQISSAATQSKFDRHPCNPGNRPQPFSRRPKTPGLHGFQGGLIQHCVTRRMLNPGIQHLTGRTDPNPQCHQSFPTPLSGQAGVEGRRIFAGQGNRLDQRRRVLRPLRRTGCDMRASARVTRRCRLTQISGR